ncbi:MAG: hypothetical protein CMJ59_21205 [Planctomycetaceae bacterium]|nr:hypothetical protein [Planctomycetaceae bacterium]
MYRSCLSLGISLLFASQSFAEEKAKIVFLSGTPSHGRMSHEHRAGNMILAEALQRSGLAVDPYVVPHYGYPKDKKILEGAATVVIFCTGHRGHILRPHLDEFDALMKKGTGVVMIHWATEAEKGKPGKKFLEWMGGFCDLDWSVNPHWTAHFKDFPKHPICNGVKPFSVNDEWYYHMRFVEDQKGLTPILSDLPPAESLRRKDGPRSGNPTVRKAVAAGRKQTVAWAYQRPGGGRGFGFTGAHNHDSWRNDGFRKTVLNAILWTAQVEVPAGGCPSQTPSKKTIEQNLDGSKKGAQKVTAKQILTSMDANRDGKISKDEASEGLKPFFDGLDANKDGVIDLKEAQVIADFSNNQQTTKSAKVPRGSPKDEEKALRLLVVTLGRVEDSRVQASLLEGMLTGLAGRRNVAPPKAWTRVATKLGKSSNPDVRELSSELSQIFGDEAATARALETVKNKSATTAQRRRALHSLLTQKNEQVSGLLEPLLDEPELRRDAIRGFAAIENADAPAILLARYKKSTVQDRKAVIETLATRKQYAEALLDSIKAKQIPSSDVPAHVARSLDFMLGEAFAKVFGDVRKLSANRTTLIEKYKKLITDDALESADASKGRAVFNKTCASCHVIYGTGGNIGPDLTGSNRANLDYILLNSVDPSYDVPEGYKMVIVQTVDGRVLNGVIAEENAQRVILKTVQQPRVVILKEDIEVRSVSKKSIMPDGQLEQMKPQEVIDLVRYLQTVEQVEVKK